MDKKIKAIGKTIKKDAMKEEKKVGKLLKEDKKHDKVIHKAEKMLKHKKTATMHHKNKMAKKK